MARRRRSFPLQKILRTTRRRKSWVVTVLLVLVIVLRWWYEATLPTPPEVLQEGVHEVERVVDGDTLLLTNHARVRLLGPDTPETVKPDHPVEPFGPEASQYTQAFVREAGRSVYLRFDRERVDKYGRFLAYVYSGERMLNEELIRQGLATAETGFRYSDAMKRLFRTAEEEAKSAKRGIWSLAP